MCLYAHQYESMNTDTEEGVLAVFKEMGVPEYANAPLLALVFTPDSNVDKHITDRPLHIFAYLCIYACAHRQATACLTDLRKNNALDPQLI